MPTALRMNTSTETVRKGFAGACDVASRVAETDSFVPFSSLHTGQLQDRSVARTHIGWFQKAHSRILSIHVSSLLARKRSIIALTCSGTSSWQKCPEPTVLPCWICGNISRKRAMSERGCGSLAST